MNTDRYALVTGASGFLGQYLVDELQRQGMGIVTMGVGKRVQPHLHLELQRLDDAAHMYELLHHLPVPVTHIFHLAGTTDPEKVNLVNVAWAKSLLEAAARLEPQPLVLLVGSAAEYGPQYANPQSQYGHRVAEHIECFPVNPYGQSKLAQTALGLAASERQPVAIARPFNIMGRGMPTHLALGNFVCQAKALPSATSGLERCIHTGPLHAVRDFIHARDCARILFELAGQPAVQGQIINVCTGAGIAMQAVVDALLVELSPPVALKSKVAASLRADVMIGSVDTLAKFCRVPESCEIASCIREMLIDYNKM